MATIWQNKYLNVLTVVLLAQAALFYTASHGDSRPLQQPLRDFPRTLDSWTLIKEGVVEPEALAVLKADDVMTRYYAKAGTNVGVNLYIAYFQTQQAGQAPHSPKNCLPGTGWQPSSTGIISLDVPGLAAPITMNKYIVTNGDSRSLVLYWYQSHGRVVADEFKARFYLVTDSVRYHRSDEALVRVVVPVEKGDDATAVNIGNDFVKAAFPTLLHYFPL